MNKTPFKVVNHVQLICVTHAAGGSRKYKKAGDTAARDFVTHA
jgi:hypothetical protein